MKYDAAIFDLDGTLLDTLDDLTDSINLALADFGFPAHTKEEVCSFVGEGLWKLVERAVPAGTDKPTIHDVFESHKKHYQAHCEDKTKPYSGILSLLETLQQHGVKTAIVSNKADPAVNRLSEKYFGSRIQLAIGERPGIARKPAPDSLLEAIRRLDAKHPLYVGDSDVDVLTAKNAAVDSIFVTWGFRSRQVLADTGAIHFADTAAELASFILSEDTK